MEACQEILVSLANSILEVPVDSSKSLVEQGLDSLSATELQIKLQRYGFVTDTACLLDGASIELLAQKFKIHNPDDPLPYLLTAIENQELPATLTGPQIIWAELDKKGWGNWANISLCMSIPTVKLPAEKLSYILQSVCDSNDAMRAFIDEPTSTAGETLLRAATDYQFPIRFECAPTRHRDAMRLIESFEGELLDIRKPSAHALILKGENLQDRHWLCITMHHLFIDRHSMNLLGKQIRHMIDSPRTPDSNTPNFQYLDYAHWRQRLRSKKKKEHSKNGIQAFLAKANLSRFHAPPRLVDQALKHLSAIPESCELTPDEYSALLALALRLDSTLPMLLHAVTSALISQLITGTEKSSEATEMFLCHVAANRGENGDLNDIVGCLDTSVPVVVELGNDETLQSYLSKTRDEYIAAVQHVSDMPRGEWLFLDQTSDLRNDWDRLFECVPHLNITRTTKAVQDGAPNSSIEIHPVRRTQSTRWGLLVRIVLSSPDDRDQTIEREDNGIDIQVLAEKPELARITKYCMLSLLRRLLQQPLEDIAKCRIQQLVEITLRDAKYAAEHLQHTVNATSAHEITEPHIYNELLKRQRLWYKHDSHLALVRDDQNRFVPTKRNPFPFTQLDKIKERKFLDSHRIPQPKLLHVITKEDLCKRLPELAPSLPLNFAIKPIGAGHSFGVVLVRNGIELTNDQKNFDVHKITARLLDLANRAICNHQGKVFQFNFSSFLIEELVLDECESSSPIDYKVFVHHDEILWIQIHFSEHGHKWVSFVDADFRVLPQPAWNPSVCWRTHHTLVCTDQTQVNKRMPGCWDEILDRSQSLGKDLGIFARLDWYSDRSKGALMGELTLFPHMLQPRSFYSSWANLKFRKASQTISHKAQRRIEFGQINRGDFLTLIEEKITQCEREGTGLEKFIPSTHHNWSSENPEISYEVLRNYVNHFDLAKFGISAGDRVGVLMDGDACSGALLFAVMNRYVAVPISSDSPSTSIVKQCEDCSVETLLALRPSDAFVNARRAARAMVNLHVIEIDPIKDSASHMYLEHKHALTDRLNTQQRGMDDCVLILRTSGSTGEPLKVTYTLSQLLRAGAAIADSINLSSEDFGISMLPLHRVGGITCNLIAPILTGGRMRFCRAFDPKLFFETCQGDQGASWCYLVPTMLDFISDYTRSNPKIEKEKSWSQLRLIRTAGSDLRPDIAIQLAELFGDRVSILPTYGMTEAMPIAAPPLPYRLTHSGSVGTALPGVSIEVVDAESSHGRTDVLPNGCLGEITIKGAMVVEPDKVIGSSSARFTERGFYRTGDLGYLASDGSGWLFLKGRTKEIINRGGETIIPIEIEREINAYPLWRDEKYQPKVMAFPRSHNQLGEDVAIAVTASPGKGCLRKINDWLALSLPASNLPTTLIHVRDIPLNRSGKPDRLAFAKLINQRLKPLDLGCSQTFSLTSPEASPQLIVETDGPSNNKHHHNGRPLLSIESVVLTIQSSFDFGFTITPDMHLGDAGVNSLAAVEISNELNAKFNAELPNWVLSDHPTPRALYLKLVENKESNRTTKVECDNQTQNAGSLSSANEAGSNAEINTKLRVLFLHGEASSAELMKLTMIARRWSGDHHSKMEFIFVDAPHSCIAKPEFHKAALQAGLYNNSHYRSWGVTQNETLQRSLDEISRTIDKEGPFDVIGGICDGGLVAALIASQRTDLKAFINVSSNPVSRLPKSWQVRDWHIPIPTLHLISRTDEFLSLSELIDLSTRCKKSSVLQHGGGHSVPNFEGEIKTEVDAFLQGIFSSLKASDRVECIKAINDEASLLKSGFLKDRNAQQGLIKETDGATRHSIERALVRAWKEVLFLTEEPNSNDDFFNLGGNSLSAAMLIYRVADAIGFQFPIRDVFECRTIQKIGEKFCAEYGVIPEFEQSITPSPLIAVNRDSQATPMSFSQERLWFLEQLDEMPSGYNLVRAWRLNGQLDTGALRRSFEAIVGRHQPLRTTFCVVDEHPVQVVRETERFPLTADQIDCNCVETQTQQIEEYCRSEAERPFDLHSDRMLRARLLRISDLDHVLLVTMHHIATDGWSMQIFLSELAQFYDQYSQGIEPCLHELKIKYTDFSIWQRRRMHSASMDESVRYWREQLEALANLDLRTDYPRPPLQNYHGDSIAFQIPETLVSELTALSHAEGLTLHMTMLAAFQILLSRYSEQTDFALGVPIAGRNHVELESLIGFFVNTLVIRADLSGDQTFRELMQRVRDNSLDAYDHQDLPFEKLVQYLQPLRDPSRSPIVQVMFQLVDFDSHGLRFQDIAVSKIPLSRQQAKFDLEMQLELTNKGISGQLIFRCDLFERATAERMATHFTQLLHEVATDPDKKQSELSLLSSAHQNQILLEWNKTKKSFDSESCIHQLFEQQAVKNPDATAVVFEEQHLSYREINERANQLAHRLCEMGVGPEVLVGLCLTRSTQLVIGILGILKAGGAYVPLDPTCPPQRLNSILQDARIEFMITDRNLKRRFPKFEGQFVCLDRDSNSLDLKSRENPRCNLKSTNLAYVMFTSGSTGKPKGVQIEHRSVSNLLTAVSTILKTNKKTRYLAITSPHFDISVAEIFLPIVVGGCTVIIPESTVQDLRKLSTSIAFHQPTIVQTTPALWGNLLEYIEPTPNGITFVSTGEELPPSLATRMLGFCDRLVNLYGPTETTIWSTSSEISADTTGIPIGKPIANTQAYVLDPFQRPVPIGVSGELYLGGVGLSRGYLNRERLTADVFITSPFSDTPDDRLYRTGDRCRWRSDGNIEFLGRMDNQVKLRGFRIELGDVEAALDEHPSVIQNVVLLRKDPPTENRLVAYYVSEDRIELKVSELRSHLLERLPEYMVPSVLISLDRMPLTSTGKIDRRALPAPELSSPHLNDHYQPPRNKIERDIAEIWCDLLSVDRVGVTDDFFEIGGHSLLAAQLFARLESKFGKKLPVSILFQNGTIRQLSELLSDPDDGSDVAFAVTLHPAAGGCPLFLLPGLQGEIMLSLGQALIQQSDGGFPVIGIQPTLPVRDPTQFKNLQSMASCYVKAICKEKPHGPYALTGYSFSGMLAFEVARQLVELGKEVRLLAIIDTGPNRNALKAGSMSRSQWIYQVISNFPSWLKEEWRQFQALAFAKRVALKLRRIYRLAISGGTARKTLDDIFGGSPVSVDKSQQAEVSFEAFCNYLPSAYAGKLTLFRAKTRPLFSGDSEDLGWTPYARTLEILEVSGDHTTIVHPPQLDDLAKQISHILGEEKPS